MKIGILGAGAMGSLFGGKLADAGFHVTLLDVNEAHVNAVNQHGLRLETGSVDRHLTHLLASTPRATKATFDLLIVFTKTIHSAQALRDAEHLVGPETTVLTLQNGLGNVELISTFIPLSRILVGVTNWPADFVAPGHIRSTGEGEVAIAAASGEESQEPKLQRVVSALSAAGLNCRADPEVWVAVWEKVAFNAALNSICAVARCSVGALGIRPDGKHLALAISEEVIAVANAAGVAADPQRTREKIVHAIEHHGNHKPSMLQDVLAGRPTEIESINGAVVAEAARRGVAVPRTATLLQLMRLSALP